MRYIIHFKAGLMRRPEESYEENIRQFMTMRRVTVIRGVRGKIQNDAICLILDFLDRVCAEMKNTF